MLIEKSKGMKVVFNGRISIEILVWIWDPSWGLHVCEAEVDFFLGPACGPTCLFI